MRIGIIGAGNLGTALGKRLAEGGHEIVVSFAREDAKVVEAAAAIGHGAKPGTPMEAAAHGEVIVLATPWGVTLKTLAAIEGAISGKIVWDATNPFAPDMSELLIGTSTSAGEEVAKQFPRARVVKAIPPFAELLMMSSIEIDGRAPGAFVCSDDAEARAIVLGLMRGIGVDAIDAGSLKRARFTEPLGMLVTNLAYVDGFGFRTAASLLHESGR